MNIEIRKFNLIQSLMKIRDAQTIDTVETLLDGVFHSSDKAPRQDSATDLPSPTLRKEKIKKRKKNKKKYVFTLDELINQR